jgi:thioredoxin-like negative regulator of GroEL
MLLMLLSAAIATLPAGSTDAYSYADAYRLAQIEGKPLMVVVSSDACPACVTLKANTLSAMQDSGELADVRVTVVNKDEDPRLASRLMRGRMIPQIIVFSESKTGWKRFQLTGYQTQGGVRSLIRRALDIKRPST